MLVTPQRTQDLLPGARVTGADAAGDAGAACKHALCCRISPGRCILLAWKNHKCCADAVTPVKSTLNDALAGIQNEMTTTDMLPLAPATCVRAIKGFQSICHASSVALQARGS